MQLCGCGFGLLVYGTILFNNLGQPTGPQKVTLPLRRRKSCSGGDTGGCEEDQVLRGRRETKAPADLRLIGYGMRHSIRTRLVLGHCRETRDRNQSTRGPQHVISGIHTAAWTL